MYDVKQLTFGGSSRRRGRIVEKRRIGAGLASVRGACCKTRKRPGNGLPRRPYHALKDQRGEKLP